MCHEMVLDRCGYDLKFLLRTCPGLFRSAPRSGGEIDKISEDLRSALTFSEVSTQTRWIKAVPIKVNIHAWKVRMNCLPTLLNISGEIIFGMDFGWWEVDFMESALRSMNEFLGSKISDHIKHKGKLCSGVLEHMDKSWMNIVHRYLVKEEASGRQLLSPRFLGHYQPQGKPALWELDSDQHQNVGSHGSNFLQRNTRYVLITSSHGNLLLLLAHYIALRLLMQPVRTAFADTPLMIIPSVTALIYLLVAKLRVAGHLEMCFSNEPSTG
ncbi:hypothetical protein Tco_0900987 [Tanacetum coccineum]